MRRAGAPQVMSGEFEDEWRRRLAEARGRAGAASSGDVAEYLALRAENDAARTAAVEWLLEVFAAPAGEANRRGASLTLARDEAHSFRVGNSTMTGPRLTLSAGVRRLSVEAGWPRAPRDGIVRGNGLACARLSHFGQRAAGENLLLARDAEGEPRWFVLDDSGARTPLAKEHVLRHFNTLLV